MHMYTRLVAIAVAVLLAVFAVPAPAPASVTTFPCHNHSRGPLRDPGRVCAGVEWHRNVHSQIIVTSAFLEATPSNAFEHKGLMVDGYKFRLFSRVGKVKWVRGTKASNIGQAGQRQWNGLHVNLGTEGTLLYEYKPRLQNAPDPDHQLLGKTFGTQLG